MDARQGRRQGEDRLRRRIEMERRCTWGAVKWKWDAVAFGRRRWLGSERGRRQRAPPCVSAAGQTECFADFGRRRRVGTKQVRRQRTPPGVIAAK